VALVCHRLLKLYGASRGELLAGTATALSLPVLFISSYAAEADILLTAILSVFVYLLCAQHVSGRALSWQRAALLGALAGLAAATKYSGLVALLLAGAWVLGLCLRDPGQRPRWVRGGLVLLFVAVCIGGYKYLDNQLQYGTPLFANGTASSGFSAGERALHWDRYDFASLRPRELLAILPPDPPLGRLTDLDVYRSVWTTLYAQTWGDMSIFSEPSRHGTGLGLYPPRGIPRVLQACLLTLALGSVGLVGLGIAAGLRRFDTAPLLGLFFFTSASYFYWVIAQPAWALKAKYLLFLFPAALVFGLLGKRALLARWPRLRAPLVVWLVATLCVAHTWLAAFAVGVQPPELRVPERVLAGGHMRLDERGLAFDPGARAPGPFTVELLVRRPPVGAAADGVENRVVYAERGAPGESWIVFDESGTLGFVFHEASGRRRGVLSMRPVEPGVWTHVAAVWTGRGIALYLDGQMQGYEPTRGRVSRPEAPAGRVGRAFDGGRAFSGAVADLRIWPEALSQSQLQAVMGREAETLAQAVQPLFDWRFDPSSAPPLRSRGSRAAVLQALR
jgi:hypothetical protein